MSTEVQTQPQSIYEAMQPDLAGPDSHVLKTGPAQSKDTTDRRSKGRTTSRKERERSIPSWEWDVVKADFLQLYSESKVPLMQCMTVMKVNYNFVASRRQYLAKIREWNVDKNIKAPEMRAAARKVLERWVLEGKDTSIEVRGKVISKDSLKRFLRRELHHQDTLPLQDKSGFNTSSFAKCPVDTYLSPQRRLSLPTASPATISRYSRWAMVEDNLGIKLDHSKTTTWLKGSPLYGANINVYSPAPNAKGLYSPSVVSLFRHESAQKSKSGVQIKASESRNFARPILSQTYEELLRHMEESMVASRNIEHSVNVKDELLICLDKSTSLPDVSRQIYDLLAGWVQSWISSRGVDYLVPRCYYPALADAAESFTFRLSTYLSDQQASGHIAITVKSSRERERCHYTPQTFHCPTCSSMVTFKKQGMRMSRAESKFLNSLQLEIQMRRDFESDLRKAMIQLADNIEVIGGATYEEHAVQDYPPPPIKNHPLDSSSHNEDYHSSFAVNTFVQTDDISIEESIDWLSQYIDFDIDEIANTNPDPDPPVIFLQDDTDTTIQYSSWQPQEYDDGFETWILAERAGLTESNKPGQSHFSKDLSTNGDESADLAKLFDLENMGGISISKSFDHWQSIQEASSKTSTNLEGFNTSMVPDPPSAFPSNEVLFSIEEGTKEAHW